MIPSSLIIGLGLLAVIVIAFIILAVTFFSEPGEWIHIKDPDMVHLMERIKKLPDYKREVIEDIADDS